MKVKLYQGFAIRVDALDTLFKGEVTSCAMENDLDWPRAVRMARAWKGMTQQEFANQLECSGSLLSLLERGLRKPSVTTLERVAVVSGLGFEQIAAWARVA